MTAREKAEQLRQEAIKELLDEKKAIEEMLKTLSYDKTAPKVKRGQKIISPEPGQPEQEQQPSRPDTIPEASI